MKNEKLNIVYLGFSGLLYGTATGEKVRLISKAINRKGSNVTLFT